MWMKPSYEDEGTCAAAVPVFTGAVFLRAAVVVAQICLNIVSETRQLPAVLPK